MKIVIHLVEDEPFPGHEIGGHPVYPIIASSGALPLNASAFQFTTGKMRLGLDMIDVVNELVNQALVREIVLADGPPVESLTGPSGYVYDFSKWLKVGQSEMVFLSEGPDVVINGPAGLCFYEVESSQLEAVSIHECASTPDASIIYVRFKESVKKGDKPRYRQGPYYRYHNCAPEQFQGLLEADSKGHWLNVVLKDNPHHPCQKYDAAAQTWKDVAIRARKEQAHERTDESSGG